MTPYGCLVERVKLLFLTKLGKWRKIITPIAAIAVLSVILFFPREQTDDHLTVESGQSPVFELLEEQPIIAEEEPIQLVEPEPVTIVVDIQGAVKYPGVYSLAEGDRLIDAIHAAGGYLPEASSRMLNHAMKLTDEFYLYVPSEGEEIDFSISDTTIIQANDDKKDDIKVNINLADIQELMTIPGIGPSKAAAIIQYREDNGAFPSTESLLDVSGIGQKTFDKLETFITVN